MTIKIKIYFPYHVLARTFKYFYNYYPLVMMTEFEEIESPVNQGLNYSIMVGTDLRLVDEIRWQN